MEQIVMPELLMTSTREVEMRILWKFLKVHESFVNLLRVYLGQINNLLLESRKSSYLSLFFKALFVHMKAMEEQISLLLSSFVLFESTRQSIH